MISSHLSAQRTPVTHHGWGTKGQSCIKYIPTPGLTPSVAIPFCCPSLIASDHAITSFRQALAQVPRPEIMHSPAFLFTFQCSAFFSY